MADPAKNLFYELEIYPAGLARHLKKMLARLGQLQDKIGVDHDLIVLKRSLRKTPDAFGGTEVIERVIDPLDEKSRKIRRRL